MSRIDDMNKTAQEIELLINRSRLLVARMIHMCVGSLRRGNAKDLILLKKELADFDSRTGEWKN